MDRRIWLVLPLVATFVGGCDSGDKRLADQAQRGAEQQAAQNQEMARVNREVAEGTRRIVQTHEELITCQRELQAERRDLANQHRQDSLLAEAIGGFVELLVCALPIIAVVVLLALAFGSLGDDAAVAEVLVQDVTADAPVVMGPARADRQLGLESPGLRLTGDKSAGHRE